VTAPPCGRGSGSEPEELGRLEDGGPLLHLHVDPLIFTVIMSGLLCGGDEILFRRLLLRLRELESQRRHLRASRAASSSAKVISTSAKLRRRSATKARHRNAVLRRRLRVRRQGGT